MNVLRILLIGAVSVFAPSYLRAQAVIAWQPPREIAPQHALSLRLERELEAYFQKEDIAAKDRASVGIPFLRDTFAMKDGRPDFRWHLDGEKSISIRSSKLVYRYEPKRWPKTFGGLVGEAIVAPLRILFAPR
ncbi:MAG TPA: hypothetical protein VHE10_00355 [Candidatus Paceibacterota bacterium]|nr:hypothetical protein [Candidatus Paceibacterota bacterium]